MDVEPIQSLAFSMHGRPKLYALLLGSGVSRAAGVMTGWEVVLDLAGKLMAMSGEKASDPHKWYRGKYKSDPDYSDLIERTAPTPAERQQVLRRYFEPDPADEADALRRPTAAHRAIADLAKRGFVKVIVTTNFDRLIESALREAGVEPMVLSSSDDIAGMMPLDHTNCCVLKLHGDYLDERIRNTTDELSKYPASLNRLLDRIFQDYGLVVCGWSGEWDVALRKAIRRAKSRRYTTYWTAYGDLSDEAERVTQAREARVIKIESADKFFEDLSNLIRSIEDYATPHPLSVKAAVAQCKRFLARDEDRIRLADLVDSTGEEALNDFADLPALSDFDGAALTNRMRRSDGICGKLLAIAVEASYWTRDDTQVDAWRNTIERFFQGAPEAGGKLTHLVGSYPAILLTYALGIGAVAAGRPKYLARVLAFPTGHEIRSWSQGMDMKTEEEVAQRLGEMLDIARSTTERLQALEGMQTSHFPMNDWLFQSLREHTTGVIPSDGRYERMFDRMEVLISLSCGLRVNKDRGELPPWFPPGCFRYRKENFNATTQEIEDSLSKEGDDSPFVRFNFVGDSATDGLVFLKSFRDSVTGVHPFHRR